MESGIDRRTINERLGESRREILRFETHAADSESCQRIRRVNGWNCVVVLRRQERRLELSSGQETGGCKMTTLELPPGKTPHKATICPSFRNFKSILKIRVSLLSSLYLQLGIFKD
jgi:hypothetical protein